MAFPTTIFSGGGIGGHQPPCKSSAGNFYSIVPISTTAIEAYKATDPEGGSWSAVDVGANNPAGFGTLSILSYVQAGDSIMCVTWDGTIYEYHRFDMSTDTWDVVDSDLGTLSGNLPTFPWCSIAVRNDGDIICVIAAETDQVMGGKKERVDYVESTNDGTSWGTHTALDAAGDIHYGNPNVVKGPLTDDMHCIWQTTSNAADPPTIWTDVEARTLDSANSLSTKVTSTNNTGAMLGIQNGVSHDEAGVDTWVNFIAPSNTALAILNFTTDGLDDIVYDSVGVPLSSAVYEKGEVGIASISEEGGDLYALYSGGSTVAADQDIYYSTSTNRGVTWTTSAEEIDGITCNCISSNIYQRDTDTVLAFVYDDAGTIKYNEKLLFAVAAASLIFKPFNYNNFLVR